MLLASLLAFAELPPPDYRDTLMRSAADEVARLARQEGMPAAVDFAKRWERTVGDDARVAYELGLAWRLAGDDGKARASLDRAVELDPSLVEARYDRGELRLNGGDLTGAEEDFRTCVELAPEQWPGHFRLADIAGRHGDPDGFEHHLLDALRYGFSFRDVLADPRWHDYLADPKLGPVLRRLVVVYQDEAVLQGLEAPLP
jgi:tetratricopeptide (TPR) repeat protein